MDIRRYQMPDQLLTGRPLYLASRRLIAETDLIGILQITRSRYYIMPVYRDRHVIIPPHAIELPGYIGRRVPALIVIFAELRVPLTHRISYPCLWIVPSAPADLQRHLRFPLEPERHRRMRQDRLGERHLHNGFFYLERLRDPVHRNGRHFLIAYLVRFKVQDAVPH